MEKHVQRHLNKQQKQGYKENQYRPQRAPLPAVQLRNVFMGRPEILKQSTIPTNQTSPVNQLSPVNQRPAPKQSKRLFIAAELARTRLPASVPVTLPPGQAKTRAHKCRCF